MGRWTVGRNGTAQVLNYLLQRFTSDDQFTVCFDYFDTLVTRTVYPEYTKQMAAKLLSLCCGGTVDSEALYRVRSALERELCEQRQAAGGELEFYLHEFGAPYLDRLRSLHEDIFPGWSADRFTGLLLDIELRVEKAVQRPLTEVVEVLKKLKQHGVSTILISDFYLPSSHFLPMLGSHGFADLFEHTFISADHGLAKGSGRLYDKVCETLACKPELFVMIGDNPHADVDMASQRGLSPVHIINPAQQEFYQGWSAAEIRSEKPFSESLAALSQETVFKEMAHSLFFFVYRLFKRLSENGTSEVFFFSKEGEFLKRLFERFQADLFGCQVITGHYLLASRKATFLASLQPLEEEDFRRLFNHYRNISCRDFLLSLNLEETVAREISEQAGLDFEARVDNFPESDLFKTLKGSSLFQSVYEQRRTEQKENFTRYLESFGFDFRKKRLTIVDVGWKGSIQDNIYHILDGETDISGYYVGSLIASERRETNRKSGLLFDDTPALTPYFHVYNNNRSLFEMILGASHGSADGYYTESQFQALGEGHRKVVGRVIESESGAIRVATLDLPEERKLFETVIGPLQEELFKGFASQAQTYLGSACMLPDNKWFAQRHARMVFTPTNAEVDFFERLYHLENFGVFEYTKFETGNTLPIHSRIKNLFHVIKSRTILESGIWPPIILRRLGVGFYRHIDGYRRYNRLFKS